ncbi:MAG: tetratricopeptide repeat protein [Ignavibacteria bacterium]|nr:tetratricopeptide repeat protein [Ignavibacteria bacterium]
MEKLIDTIIDLIEENKYKEALSECSKLVFHYPLNPLGYELRGDCFLYFKKYNLAFINYREAISLTNATDVRNRNSLSLLYKKKGICNLKTRNFKPAVEDFTNSINFNPDNYEAYHLRSKALRKIGDYESALKDANKAIELFSEYAEAYNNRGCIYYMTNKPDEAIKDFTKAIELKPDYGGAYYNRSLVYKNIKNDLQSAEQDLEKAEIFRAQKSQPPQKIKITRTEEIREQDKITSYEEKREKFSNITIDEGLKLSEGLFESSESKPNVIELKSTNKEIEESEGKSFSDIFATEGKTVDQAEEANLNNYAVEEVLEAKHKSENLSSPFTETQEGKSLEDLVSEVKIPEELKELHNQIVLPPQEETNPKEEPKKEKLIREKLETKDSKEQEKEIQKKDYKEKPEPKLYSKYLYDEPKKNYTTLYFIIGILILLFIVGGIFLVKLLQNKTETNKQVTTETGKKIFVIYEKGDSNKITVSEDFEKVMSEKGLVLVAVDSGFKFQAGSFKDSVYAVSRSKWLEEQEFEPEIQLADLKDKGKFYRVRFGDFKTVEEADSVARTIK